MHQSCSHSSHWILSRRSRKSAGVVAHGRNPFVGGQFLELRGVRRRPCCTRPKRLERDVILKKIPAAVAAHEIHKPCLSLLSKFGRENEKLVEKVHRQGAQRGHGNPLMQKSRNQLVVPFGELDDILKGIAGEDLVSSLAADDHFEIARRALRELVKGNDECISDRPVHVPDDFGKKVKVLRSALDFMMIGAEEPGRLGGIVRFVNGRVEADGVGIHLVARLRHERDKQRGVHTGAEISADRNVAAHREPHRVPQHRLGLIKQFGFGRIFALKIGTSQ